MKWLNVTSYIQVESLEDAEFCKSWCLDHLKLSQTGSSELLSTYSTMVVLHFF